MSALSNNKEIWSLTGDCLDSKYEKCRNITEEIYKRINITFQIKKLENSVQSDLSEHSDQIDSNDLSNETDLFACDKSDSLSSSTEAEKPTNTCEKYININNNEETKKKAAAVYKRPRKRFRKRVKKRQTKSNRSDTECSSDEAVPLSRIVEVDKSAACPLSESPDNVMGVPNIVIVPRDLKPKCPAEKRSQVKEPQKKEELKEDTFVKQQKGSHEWKCTLCSLSFRGERGLRRHMTMSHIVNADETVKSNKTEQRHKLL